MLYFIYIIGLMLKVNIYGKIEEVNRENHELISIRVPILFYSLFEKFSFDEIRNL